MTGLATSIGSKVSELATGARVAVCGALVAMTMVLVMVAPTGAAAHGAASHATQAQTRLAVNTSIETSPSVQRELARLGGALTVRDELARLSGASGRLDTVAKVAHLQGRIHTTAELEAYLSQMPRAEQTYVIRMGYMPHRRVLSRVIRRTLQREEGSIDTSCPSFNITATYISNDYAWTGFHIAEYQSKWNWAGMCWVHYAQHWEGSTYTGIGWQFNGDKYGLAYGGLNTPMIGRETIATFQFGIIAPAYDYDDMSVEVTAGWGNPPRQLIGWDSWSGN